MIYPKHSYLFLLLFFASCSNETQPSYAFGSGGGKENKIEFEREREGYNKTTSGLYYLMHKDLGNEKAKVNDYLVADLSYATEGGHKIFSKENLSFKFTRSLFSGALNEGLQMMGSGDEASFIIAPDKVYLKDIPSFVNEGEGIIYNIALHHILDKKGYDKHLKAQSSKPSRAKKTQPLVNNKK